MRQLDAQNTAGPVEVPASAACAMRNSRRRRRIPCLSRGRPAAPRRRATRSRSPGYHRRLPAAGAGPEQPHGDTIGPRQNRQRLRPHDIRTERANFDSFDCKHAHDVDCVCGCRQPAPPGWRPRLPISDGDVVHHRHGARRGPRGILRRLAGTCLLLTFPVRPHVATIAGHVTVSG